MVSFRELRNALVKLGLNGRSRALVHGWLPAFRELRGGAETLAGAVAGVCGLVVMPAFTPQCEVRPQVGPADNGMTYRDEAERNAQAEFFQVDLSASAETGAEALRRLAGAQRSAHPLLSFVAVGAEAQTVLEAQTLAQPLGAVERLAELQADVVLLGAPHTDNFALHLAMRRAGRRTFTRWALTPAGVVVCPVMPGCSAGFDAIVPRLPRATRTEWAGPALLHRIPLPALLADVEPWLRAAPAALRCGRAGCELCAAETEDGSRRTL